MNDFNKYMDRVTAGQDLKDKTKDYVLTTLSAQTKETVLMNRLGERKVNFMKKRIITASAIAACAIFAIGGYAFYQTPVSYVSVDINPSVELGVNAFNKVVAVNPVNEDGKTIVDGKKFTFQNVKQVVNTLVQAAADKGFVAADGSTVIAVTSETDNDQQTEDLQNAGQEGAKAALEDKQVNAVVYTNAASLALRTEAKDAGISPGKYKMIKLLMILDPTINVEDYQDAKMTAIIEKANELLSTSENVDQKIAEIKDAFTTVKDTASQVEKNKGQSNGKGNKDEDDQTSTETSSLTSDAASSTVSSVSSKNENGNAYGTSKKTTSSTISIQDQQSASTDEQSQSSKATGNGNGNSAKSSIPAGSESSNVKGNGKG